jgi:chaperone modulatory protein CbpM
MTRFYSKTEVVARVEGLTMRRLEAFVETDCIRPCHRGGEAAFTESDVARLQLLSELAQDFDLDADAAGLVIGLIDQIHGLRRELRVLGEAVARETADVRARIIGRLGAG